MTVVLDVAVPLQPAPPDWMTEPWLQLVFLLFLTVAAVVILWDEFREPERTSSDGEQAGNAIDAALADIDNRTREERNR